MEIHIKDLVLGQHIFQAACDFSGGEDMELIHAGKRWFSSGPQTMDAFVAEFEVIAIDNVVTVPGSQWRPRDDERGDRPRAKALLKLVKQHSGDKQLRGGDISWVYEGATKDHYLTLGEATLAGNPTTATIKVTPAKDMRIPHYFVELPDGSTHCYSPVIDECEAFCNHNHLVYTITTEKD
jgi:hypothetical protein